MVSVLQNHYATNPDHYVLLTYRASGFSFELIRVMASSISLYSTMGRIGPKI